MADASSEFNKMSLQFERTTERLEDLQTSAIQLNAVLASLDVSTTGQNASSGKSRAEASGSSDKGNAGGLRALNDCKGHLDKLVQLAQKGADYDAQIALIGQSIPNFNDEMRQHLATINRGLAADKNIVAAGGDWNAILEAQLEAVQSHSLEGANAEKLEAYTRSIGLYAASSGIPFKEASAVVMDMHDKLGITSEEEFTDLGNRMTAAGNALGVRVSEIGGALATSGAWADKAGVKKEDSAALIAALLKGGMNQQEASSSFASMMKSFSTANHLSVNDAQRLGFSNGHELNAALQQDMVGTLNGVLDKLGAMDPAAQMQLATQLFGADGQKIVRSLKTDDDGKSLADFLREARAKTHSEKDAITGQEKNLVDPKDTMVAKAAAINDTAKVHFAQMNSQFEHLALIMSESLVPVTVTVVDKVAQLVAGLNGFLEAHPALVKGVGGVVAAFMAGKVAAIGLKAAFSGLKFLVSDVKKLLGKGGNGSSGGSGNTALASSANKAAAAIRRLTLRIAELNSTASSADGLGGDDFEPSSRSERKRNKRSRKGSRTMRKWKVTLKRLKLGGVGRVFKNIGRSHIGKMAMAGLGSSLLSGDGLLHGVMSKGMSLFSDGGGLVSKVMGSGALKGAGKLAGKLFKPLGFLQDGWNLAEGMAKGDSHQVGKAAGSAVGGWGGGLAGATAGAAIGSVVPVVGTAIGGVVGGVLGSLGGSSAGEWLGDKAASVYDWFTGGSKDKKDGEQGGQILASLKEHTLSLLPDSSTPRRLWDSMFGGDDATLKTMNASKALPESRLHDPKSSAEAVINSSTTTNTAVTQNINVTLHASSDSAQNQQLIDQLMQRLRNELATGQPGANTSLNRRINAGLTDAATA